MKKLTIGVAIATALLTFPGLAAAKKTRIVETTPQGFAMVLKAKGGGGGKLKLACPNGTKLGSAKFSFKGRKFSAANGSLWHFAGKLNFKGQQFSGSGATKAGACGAGVATSFSEPVPTGVVWTSCPNNDVLNPIAAGTPITFKGNLAGAALGTHLRIEYTDPGPAITDVVHVTTDASGNFTDTHAFPSSGGSEYGASAIARFPDQSLATGASCGLNIQ